MILSSSLLSLHEELDDANSAGQRGWDGIIVILEPIELLVSGFAAIIRFRGAAEQQRGCGVGGFLEEHAAGLVEESAFFEVLALESRLSDFQMCANEELCDS